MSKWREGLKPKLMGILQGIPGKRVNKKWASPNTSIFRERETYVRTNCGPPTFVSMEEGPPPQLQMNQARKSGEIIQEELLKKLNDRPLESNELDEYASTPITAVRTKVPRHCSGRQRHPSISERLDKLIIERNCHNR